MPQQIALVRCFRPYSNQLLRPRHQLIELLVRKP